MSKWQLRRRRARRRARRTRQTETVLYTPGAAKCNCNLKWRHTLYSKSTATTYYALSNVIIAYYNTMRIALRLLLATTVPLVCYVGRAKCADTASASAPNQCQAPSRPEHHKYCVVGAGPAGMPQLTSFTA